MGPPLLSGGRRGCPARLHRLTAARPPPAAPRPPARRKRYVEEQLAKRLGRDQGGGDGDGAVPAAAPGEDGLMPMKQRQIDTELGPSWVSGILEVPLTMEQRLKNIEDTEAAKKKMLLAAGGRR